MKDTICLLFIDGTILVFVIFILIIIIVLLYLWWKKTVGALSVTVNVDKNLYTPNETVNIDGSVSINGTPVENESVAMAIAPPTGDAYSLPSSLTDVDGLFSKTWTVPSDAVEGVYTLTATARGVSKTTTFTFHHEVS